MKFLVTSFLFLNFLYAQKVSFSGDFLFGVANAPAHVEDEVVDPWIDFASKGKSKAYLNQIEPEKRLEFWSKPEIEIDLASELGTQIFRLGVSWQRLMPKKDQKQIDAKVVKRYREIFSMIKEKGMKIMLSLFHHSIPGWAIQMGGWTNPELSSLFVDFSMQVTKAFSDQVDFLVTFNEANVYTMFSYVGGIWPPGIRNEMAVLNIPFIYKGGFYKALDHMAKAHNEYYKKIKPLYPSLPISVAHNIAIYKPHKWWHKFNAWWSHKYMNLYFLDKVKAHLDYLGFNYYGQEFLDFKGPVFKDGVDYNDAGRAIYPEGLSQALELLYQRYKLPLFITENGTADEADLFRTHYLMSHLKAIHHSIKNGIPVLGYIHWTLTDNFEWSDGYCPKFGLVSVDRKNNHKRLKRQSFFDYQKIIEDRGFFEKDLLLKATDLKTKRGTQRSMCRGADGKSALDKPRYISL